MDVGNQDICRLCFGTTTIDGEDINDIQKEILDVLLIKLDWTINEKPMLCGTCSTTLQDSFTFKSNCIDIEDYLTTFMENDELDLKKVYRKKSLLQNQLLCRLCIEITERNDLVLSEPDKEKFKLYLPEINLGTTSDVVICAKCYNCLQKYFIFIETSLQNEQKLLDYCKEIGRRRKREIYLHQFLKYSSSEDIFSSIEVPNGKRKKRTKKLSEYKCVICSYTTTNSFYIRLHQVSHVKSADTAIFKCTLCPLQTKYKTVLRKHMATKHSDHKYFCDKCSFETKHKLSIRRHVATHETTTIHECKPCVSKTKNLSVLEKPKCRIKKAKKVLKCMECPYKTTRGSRLKVHALRHKKPSECEMYKCTLCNFSTKRKSTLKKHIAVHRKPEITLYKCPHCQFETFETGCLKTHLKLHDESFEMQNKDDYISKLVEPSYKCSQCDFASKNDRGLKKHISFKHSGIKMKFNRKKVITVKREKLECSICGYKTDNSSYLRRHMKIHLDPSQVEMHKCDECSFETKWPDCLVNHKNKHKDPSEVKMFQCHLCSFKTRHRKTMSNHKMHKHNFSFQIHKCNICSFETKWLASLQSHQIVHAAPHLKCNKCTFQTKYPRSLRNHLRDKHTSSTTNEKQSTNENDSSANINEVTYQCADCKHQFRDKSYLVRHIHNVHRKDKEVIYNCEKCPFTSKWKNSYLNHQKVHKGKDELQLFECKQCDYKTKHKRVLKNHISNLHEEKIQLEGYLI